MFPLDNWYPLKPLRCGASN